MIEIDDIRHEFYWFDANLIQKEMKEPRTIIFITIDFGYELESWHEK